ncbi:MAG TPA: oligosaccharide flippase family protein [Acidobacteriaceae bacterium]
MNTELSAQPPEAAEDAAEATAAGLNSTYVDDPGATLPVPAPIDHAGPRKRSALLNVMQSAGGRALFVLVNAATGILTARALHPSGRGEMAAMGVWPNFLPNLMTLGLPSALIYHFRRPGAHRTTLLRAALLLGLILGLLSTVVGDAAMPFWLDHYPARVIHLAQLFMLNGTIVLLIGVARAACEAKEDFFASSLSLALTPLVTLLLLSAFLLAGGLTPTTACLSYVVAGTPILLFLFSRIVPDLRGRAASLLASSRALLGYGVRSYGVDLCGTLALYADQALVVRLLEPAAMGVYAVALSLSRTLSVLQTAVASVLFPKALGLRPAELLELTSRAARLSLIFSMLAGTLVGLLGPILLPLLYGRDYRHAVTLLNILIAEAIVTGATLVLTQAHMALGRPGAVTLIQSSGIAFSIPLLLLLIPRFGLVGASSALLIASFLRLLLTLASFPVLLRVGVPRLVPVKQDFVQLHGQLQRLTTPRA